MSQSAARGLRLSQASPCWLCAVGFCHLVGAEAHVHKAGRPQPSSGSSFSPCGIKPVARRPLDSERERQGWVQSQVRPQVWGARLRKYTLNKQNEKLPLPNCQVPQPRRGWRTLPTWTPSPPEAGAHRCTVSPPAPRLHMRTPTHATTWAAGAMQSRSAARRAALA